MVAPELIEDYKRYTGRTPASIPSSSLLVPSKAPSASQEDIPLRRRPGRPRKNPANTPAALDTAGATPAPPRRRGRPPKATVPGGRSA